MLNLLFASVLLLQDPAAAAPEAAPAPAARPAEATKAPVRKANGAKREDLLARREAQAERSARQAKAEKVRAAQERARQARMKQAEQKEIKKALELEAHAKGLQAKAEAHRKRAEAIRKQANDSWSAYQAASRGAVPAPAKPAEESPRPPEATPKTEQ